MAGAVTARRQDAKKIAVSIDAAGIATIAMKAPMKKARIRLQANLTIDPSEFAKTKEWDPERLRNIIQELAFFEMRVKSVSGIQMRIEVIAPTNLEILEAIRAAE